MVDRERLYLALPIPLQHLACSVEGLRIQRSRYGGDYRRIEAEVRARDRWSRDRIETLRRERLRAFVDHAFRTVPYYRRLARERGFDPASVREVGDLAALPVLDKATVQREGAAMISEAVPRAERIIAHTSGSTGAGLRFATTLAATQEQWAVWWRYRGWHGIGHDMWCGYFGGRSVVPSAAVRPPFWRYNLPGKQILFSGYHMADRFLPDYVAELRRRKPRWLHGYPSLIALLAGYLLHTGGDLGYDLVAVTTGAENLLPQQAELIERGLGVRPRQHYGLAEAVANISECERGAMHVDDDFAVVELDPGGRILGTNLSNPATPLLRYDTNDVARLAPGATCGCGRAGRVVDGVDGRQEDYVILDNRARVGRMDHVFKDLVTIREAQIVQERLGAIVVRVVPGAGYDDAAERLLLEELHKRVGAGLAITIERTDRLERTATGKLRLVVSHLKEGQLTGDG